MAVAESTASKKRKLPAMLSPVKRSRKALVKPSPGMISIMLPMIMVSGEEWFDLDKPIPTRRITKISKVFEVSAVNDGAYPQTEIYARSASLDNAKNALDNARAVALDNEKRAKAQASLSLEKQKFLYLEALKNDY